MQYNGAVTSRLLVCKIAQKKAGKGIIATQALAFAALHLYACIVNTTALQRSKQVLGSPHESISLCEDAAAAMPWLQAVHPSGHAQLISVPA